MLEYASQLQFIQSRHGTYPKVLVIQDYDVYLQNEPKGALVTAMLLDALNALSRAFNSPTYMLAGLRTSEKESIKILPAIMDNYFSTVWKVKTDDEGNGSLTNYPGCEFNPQIKEIKFKIGKDDVLFMENICEHFI